MRAPVVKKAATLIVVGKQVPNHAAPPEVRPLRSVTNGIAKLNAKRELPSRIQRRGGHRYEPLTCAEKEVIRWIFNVCGKEEMATSCVRGDLFTLTGEHFSNLVRERWLTDEIMNAMVSLIDKAHKEDRLVNGDGVVKRHVFTTFFMPLYV